MQFACAHCGANFEASPHDRRMEHVFCGHAHFQVWRRAQRLQAARSNGQPERYYRFLWGFGVSGATSGGRLQTVTWPHLEAWALDWILPAAGFTDLERFSPHRNASSIAFLGNKDGRRVLIDVTSKLRANVAQKLLRAKLLQLPLFVLHVSPAHPDVHWLAEPTVPISQVPLTLLAELERTL